MRDKEKIVKHYSGIKNSLDTALEIIRKSDIDDEDTKKMMNDLSTKLNSLNASFKADIDKLENQSEWDKLCIAFFGETNAGKSTLIEALRILYNEQTRMSEIEKSTKEYENAVASNNENYRMVDEKLKDYTKVIDNYATKIYAREKKYQTDIINLQKALQYSISESDRKQKHYQTTISNLQNTIGISIDNAAKQECIYKSRIKKIKTIAIIACLFCIVVGYYLANII